MTMTDFSSLAVAGVQALRPYEPGKPVETLERELGIREAVKLASNENPLGPSPKAVAAMQAALGGVHIYPDGNGFALKQALADRHRASPAQITLGNGSNEILELVARAWLAPGRSAVFSRHAFAVYPLVVQAVSADARVAEALPAGADQPFGHDLGAMAALVDESTRVVFIANPNNPTGTWVGGAELEAFVAGVPAQTLVVVDEAYAEYVEVADYPDTTQWVARFPNLIVTRTFSKIHGLAGLRLGYSVSSEPVAELLNRVRQPFNVNTLAQAAGLAALGDPGHVERSARVNREGLRQLEAGLRERGLDFIPSVGNFLTFDVRQPPGPVYERLLRQGVIVRPVVNYGLPTQLRVTVGRAEENARFLQALDAVLAAA
ncbi:Histidinol-phosphate aminotransferase [Thioalkalivibrio nitratireducens DSM 14787]|uniref:Histidinol-phosphate aminotransferase n=1 Tax=Thioalkalivibrio nitratireducens (strain DSM 14787 / UNIQEM 213 / ALEN2) TaxID=1255043 RepID=L0DYP2_THIND|nr:histidinol-phosphate transaminase [Thioalkalivibrio nitratireducens]AGA33471.1 Histidinol-phosphate aminotransferase [Thioalkalivibrio nitratireducens DSM 14787]